MNNHRLVSVAQKNDEKDMRLGTMTSKPKYSRKRKKIDCFI